MGGRISAQRDAPLKSIERLINGDVRKSVAGERSNLKATADEACLIYSAQNHGIKVDEPHEQSRFRRFTKKTGRHEPHLYPLWTIEQIAEGAGVEVEYLTTIVKGELDGRWEAANNAVPFWTQGSRKPRRVFKPLPPYKPVVDWLYANVCVPLDDLVGQEAFAYRYAIKRSAVDCVRPHAASDFLIKADIASFFDSIKQPRVEAIFQDKGYDKSIAKILSMLCTTFDRFTESRILPQGFPTSGVISNLVLDDFDELLTNYLNGFCSQNARGKHLCNSIVYTRYADDI